MKIKITARHESLSDTIKQYAQEKGEKLSKYYPRLVSLDVVIEEEGEKFRAELIAKAPKGVKFVAHALEGDTHSAFDAARKKLEQQLSKHRKKTQSHRGKRVANAVLDTEQGRLVVNRWQGTSWEE